MDYASEGNGARTDADQSGLPDEFRVNFESLRSPEKLRSMGDLYFIQAESAVKIGHSRDIAKRLTAIRVHNHCDIQLVALLSGRGFEEPAWHAVFHQERIRGEWYRLTPALAKAIGLAKRGRDWWGHVYPPFSYLMEHTDPDDEDEEAAIEEACVDWDILLTLYTHPSRLTA